MLASTVVYSSFLRSYLYAMEKSIIILVGISYEYNSEHSTYCTSMVELIYLIRFRLLVQLYVHFLLKMKFDFISQGMDVVKKVESYGSQSGKTSAKVLK